MKVLFLPVQKPKDKIDRVLELATSHFRQKNALLIIADEKAALYIDELLWKEPKEGFIPHLFVKTPTDELIAITDLLENLNNAKSILNLTVTPLSLSCETLYELDDPTKKEHVKEKIAFYRSKNLNLSTL